jgi:hypothetical protein
MNRAPRHLGGVVGNPGAAQEIPDLVVRSDPNRKHGLRRAAVFFTILADQAGYRGGDIVSRSDRSLNIHYQDCINARVGQQDFQRRRVARGVGIAHDIDGIRSGPCRRQHRVELLPGLRGDDSGNPPQFDKPVDRENTDAAAIGQDRQPLARRRFDPPQRFSAIE